MIGAVFTIDPVAVIRSESKRLSRENNRRNKAELARQMKINAEMSRILVGS